MNRLKLTASGLAYWALRAAILVVATWFMLASRVSASESSFRAIGGILVPVVCAFAFLATFLPAAALDDSGLRVRQLIRSKHYSADQIRSARISPPIRVWVKPWGGFVRVAFLELSFGGSIAMTKVNASMHIASESFPAHNEEVSKVIVQLMNRSHDGKSNVDREISPSPGSK